MAEQEEDWEKVETALVQPLPFTAVSVFENRITPETIVDALLEEFGSVDALVICKKWGELFNGSGSGDSKKPGAYDLLKELATKAFTGKKMDVVFGGRKVAEVTEKNTAAQYLYSDETLTRMEEQLEQMKLDIKQRKEKLQKAKKDVPDANGEIMIPAQLLAQGTTLNVKFIR